MEMSHNFRFRWNDHVPHLSQIFSELRFEEVYCDTTLISDDGFVLKAHGAVLCATSRYFERVLLDVTADQHPIIVLKGANFMELSCLLDYIYQGVTQVDQHLMESVLDVADMLEIKGLSKMKNNLSIKKLIAPSPASPVISRNSPLCSSPSKSPPPPSQNSQSHSLSCPSSPNESYANSTLLKMDTEDADELNPKSQHASFRDTRTRVMENQEYESAKQPSCSNSEYLDQTLGIDLSLSRATNEDSDRASVKNFNIYEDALLRKRKVMKKAEEVNPPSFPDLEWEKGTEKGDEIVPHKKKLYTRPGSMKEEYRPISRLQSESNENEEDGDSNTTQILYFNGVKEAGSEIREDFESINADDFNFSQRRSSGSESNFHSDSQYYEDTDDPCDNYLSLPSEESDTANGVRYMKQNPYLLTSQISKERASSIDPSCHPQKRRKLESAFQPTTPMPELNGNINSSKVNSSDVWVRSGIILLPKQREKRETQSGAAECHPHPQQYRGSPVLIKDDVTDFVSLKITQPDQLQGTSWSMAREITQQAFLAIDSKVKRPVSKIKRPLSKYTLFMKENYSSVSEQNPGKKSADIIKIISTMWRNLSPEEKQRWEEKASELQREFKIQNPNYVYCSKKFQDLKYEYDQKKEEKRNMFKINPYSWNGQTFMKREF